MSFAIVTAAAAVVGTGFSIYAGIEQQQRAATLARNAQADAEAEQLKEQQQKVLSEEQGADVALRTQGEQNQPYTRSGTILAGGTTSSGAGVVEGGKTLLGG